MNARFLSTRAPAPPGFEVERLTKRLLLGGPVALYTDAPEQVLALFDRFTDRVQGLLITPGESYRHQRLGPLLWRVWAPEGLHAELHGLAAQQLDMLACAATFEEERGALERQVHRAQYDLEATRQDYNRVTSKLQHRVFELSATQQALRESEGRLRAIIDSSADAIFIKDLTGRYLLANPAAAAFVGSPIDEVVGRTAGELFPPESAKRIQAHDRLIIERNALNTSEEVLVNKANVERTYLATKVPFYSDDGRAIGVIGISRDITEYKRAEREQIAMKAREEQARAEAEAAKQLNTLQSAFLNAVSHELRTPLASIIGYAEFLEDHIGGDLTAQQEDFIAQIQAGARRLKHLVDDLLDTARLEAGAFKLTLEEAEFSGKVREMVDSLRPQMEEARLALEVDLPSEPLRARFDVHRVEQILINLLSNAIKFTPEGGRIRVAARLEGDRLRCEVADTGIGIAPEDQPLLFQRFRQLAGGLRREAGTGLGLNITKALVEAHDGTIGVESTPGVGTTFWFTLPLEGARSLLPVTSPLLRDDF